MSEYQKNQAEQVIDWADSRIHNGFDSMTVFRQALHKLDQLALNSYDYRRYRMRIEAITGVK